MFRDKHTPKQQRLNIKLLGEFKNLLEAWKLDEMIKQKDSWRKW